MGGCSPRIEYFINSSLFTIVTRALIPWVPKAFHAQFPISVKSFLKICHPALFSFRLFAFDQLFVKKPADLRLCDQSPTTKVNNTLSFHPLTNRGGIIPCVIQGIGKKRVLKWLEGISTRWSTFKRVAQPYYSLCFISWGAGTSCRSLFIMMEFLHFRSYYFLMIF